MSLWSKLKQSVKQDVKKEAKDAQVEVADKKKETKKSPEKDKAQASKNEAKKTEKKEEKKDKNVAVKETGNAYRVLLAPMMTEKTVRQETMGQYSFKVAKSANKIEVKKAVHAVYGVMPEQVRIVITKPRNVRFRAKKGVQGAWKKAIVILKKGDKIDVS